jgi:hypothetical protein
MSEEFLLTRKTALLARANATDPDIEKTIGQLAAVSLAVGDIGGELATEVTTTAINAKLPNLSNNRIPVELPTTNLTADWRILTAGTTTIPAGSCYVYLTILTGTVTINGLTKTATNGINDIVNLESCLPARHPAITIVIPEGASIELIRGF